MNMRKVHRAVGLVFSPFFLLTAVTGIILLWRKAEVYGSDVKGILIGLHNWEIAAKYIGVILAAGLIYMAITGLLMILFPGKFKSDD
uniref:PepSY-associated TM region n=1 Tax=Candidatus Kentrum sp. TC TaxID=2126339 RepID=A0A450YYU7_9GAMM|nr:MAG: hypothetical protein BECKTC1821E_GA0114239_106811 [Candidatus Kentron sp. TC]